MIDDVLSKLKVGNNLSYDETSVSMESILNGNISDQDTVNFLKYLRKKVKQIMSYLEC